jgi:acetyl esterase/lipase
VYALAAHAAHEAQRVVGSWPLELRGVAHLSPMTPAMGGADALHDASPVVRVARMARAAAARVPPLWLAHGLDDGTAPAGGSVRFADALRAHGARVELALWSGHDHFSPLMALFELGDGQSDARPPTPAPTPLRPTLDAPAPSVAQVRAEVLAAVERFGRVLGSGHAKL